MSVIASPKSLATRGRLIQIEGGSNLIPAILLDADTRGILQATADNDIRKVYAINQNRVATFKLRNLRIDQPKLEIRYVG